MITSVEGWIGFLRDSHFIGGVPLVAAGVGLMLFGWRLWNASVVLAFAVIGAFAAAYFVEPGPNQWVYAVGGGALLALASFYPVNYAVALLGGLLTAAIARYYLIGMNVEGTSLWVASGVALTIGTAFSVLNRQHVVVAVTAFLGATLLISGLAAWVMEMPSLFNTIRSMASGSIIVVPFLLIVPMVMSCFYQVGEMHRLQAQV